MAERLAEVARVLEAAGHAPEVVAGFLSRCLFSMFAEDVGLLPKRAFVDLLESLKDNPAQFIPLVGEVWRAMDRGEFSAAVRADRRTIGNRLSLHSTIARKANPHADFQRCLKKPVNIGQQAGLQM